MYKLDCVHIFCYDCLLTWAKECSSTAVCPQRQCRAPILSNHLQRLLSLSDYEAYLNTLLRTNLMTLPNFHFCPNCPNGFFIEEMEPGCSPRCPNCSFTFCAKCRLLVHSRMSCEEAFKLQSIEEQENGLWKSKNTKQCPNCKVYIQKTDGCSHMTCTKCSYQFCWICLGVYISGRRTNGNVCPCK